MNRIREFRDQANLSQADIAKRLNISQQAIAKWESGESLPRAEKLPQLAALLGCRIDDLLSDDPAS